MKDMATENIVIGGLAVLGVVVLLVLFVYVVKQIIMRKED
jgi:preprotein translocase subunit SecE